MSIIIKPGDFEPNTDIRKFRQKHNIHTVDTNEILGTYKLKYQIVCAECNKVYEVEASNDAEVEYFCEHTGWKIATDENGKEVPVCPFCSVKLLKEQIDVKN